MSRIITGDESWVHRYEPEMKQQLSQWKSPSSPRPKTTRKNRSSIKGVLIVFSNICIIVQREFIPQGQPVNRQFLLRRFERRNLAKRPVLQSAKNRILHDDNASCHRSLLSREFLIKNNTVSLLHQPYSSHLANFLRASISFPR
ncbi:uncharacterized protein LOC106876633 [Octopus bimaculoides]|uniref:uncharacterized protein LOC106876633 n=1 Tax=Octopus bimaculoides TaxID=37653 RepID=UPI00071CE269|nr:uncharacterized protein LOC106876633 [Octopus bimaculoides]|eukprot:XP_014780733.1 PREDICTED: uncharacterized protein LOC106876633 [Octopus bimaculoides]